MAEASLPSAQVSPRSAEASLPSAVQARAELAEAQHQVAQDSPAAVAQRSQPEVVRQAAAQVLRAAV